MSPSPEHDLAVPALDDTRIHVRFWGTRGSIPTPGPRTRRYGGNTACVEIRHGETLIIIDGGSGIRELGMELVRRGKPVEAHLLFSHMHWDHIQGFPYFAPAFIPTSRLHIYDEGKTYGKFYSLLSGQMKADYFPVLFKDLRSQITAAQLGDSETHIGGLRVIHQPLHHPGGSLGYRFETPSADGSTTRVVYASDNELEQILTGTGFDTKDGPRPVESWMVDFVRDADLLIGDAQFTDAECPNRKGWGHSSAATLVDLAVQANVRRLALFHHDPGRSDAQVEEIAEACRERARRWGSGLQVFAAREGVELTEGAAAV